MSFDEGKKFYLVTVTLNSLDKLGIENGLLATTHVPTQANNKTSAIQAAVVYQSDGGVAVENDRLIYECMETSRGIVWLAERVIEISEEEFDIYIMLTKGSSNKVYCVAD